MKAMARGSQQPRLKHTLILAVYFQVCWLLTALIVTAAGQYVSIWWLLVIIPTFWVPLVLELLTNIRLPSTLQVHYYLFVSAAAVLGDTFGFYSMVWRWDTLSHFDSGIVFAWLGLFMIRAIELDWGPWFPRWIGVATALAVSMAFAAVWEIVEFASDRLIHTTAQHGLTDTMVDMIAAAVGAILTVTFVRFMTPKNLRPKAFVSARLPNS